MKISDSVASILGWLMTNEKEDIWKEVVVASVWYNASIYLEQMGKRLSVRVTEVLLVLNWAPPNYKCRELPQHQPAWLCYQRYKKNLNHYSKV